MNISEAIPFLRKNDTLSKEDFDGFVTEMLEIASLIQDEDLCMARYFYAQEESGKTSGVYFIKNKYTGLVKIGCTSDIKGRYATLDGLFRNQFGAPDALQIIGFLLIEPRFILKVESMIHRALSCHRKYGEWFEVSDDDIAPWMLGDVLLNNGILITGVFGEDIYSLIDYKTQLLRTNQSVSGIEREHKFFEWLFKNYRGCVSFNEKILRAIYDISPSATSCSTLW